MSDIPKIKVNVSVVSISKVHPNPWNPNVQSDFIFERELRSIQRHGMVLPILVREMPAGKGGGYEIIDGEHRWKACAQLGMKEIPINNQGKLSDALCQELTVLMNEIKGKAETGLLGDLMKGLEQSIGLATLTEIMPYSGVELESMIKMATVDFGALNPNASDEGKKTEAPGTPGLPPDPEGWSTLVYRLPTAVASQFEAQVLRMKRALHPEDENVRGVPDVQPIEAIAQLLAQTPDDQLL